MAEETYFIKKDKIKFLEEDCNQEDDLFNFIERQDVLEKKLLSLDGNCFVGVVGRFGFGKTTMLENIKKKRLNEENEKWFDVFECWKYSEKQELYENFLLHFVCNNKEKKVY